MYLSEHDRKYKHNGTHWRKKGFWLGRLSRKILIVAWASLTSFASVQANVLAERPFQHVAIDQHLKEVLEYFVSGYAINASFSDTFINEAFPLINGQFEEDSGIDFLDKMSNLYNLTWYFDGRILHITLGADQQKRLHKISQAKAIQLRRVLRSMNAFSGRFSWNYLPEIRALEVYGQPMFLKNVRETLNVVASISISDDGSEITRPDPKPDDFIVMHFDLKYASAEDTYYTFRGRNTVNLGVVSRLRAMFSVGANTIEAEAAARNDQVNNQLAATPRNQVNAIPGNNAKSTFTHINGQLVPAPPLPDLSTRNRPQGGSGLPGSAKTNRSGKPVPYISHDPINNRIIVYDERQREEQYRRAIEAMDTYSAQIQIEVTILEVSVERLNEIGVNWTAGGNGRSLSVNSGLATNSGINLRTSDLSPGENIGNILTGNATRIVSNVQALASDGDGQVISQPAVMTIDNTPALIDNTQTFFVRVNSEDAVGLYDVTVGSTLEVKPRILSDQESRKIYLEVKIQDGTVNNELIDEIPTVKENTIETRASIEENTSLIVGGYFFDTTTNSSAGTPFLNKIPVVKHLFSSQRKYTQRRMKMFIITPTIIDQEKRAQRLANEIQTQVQSKKIFESDTIIRPLNRIFD